MRQLLLTFFALLASVCANAQEVVTVDGIRYCKNLKTVYIGSGIKIMNYHIFEGCSNLRDIYLKAVKCPQIPLGAFDKDVPCDRITLHVPNDVVDMYKGMIPWNKFKIVGM